MKSILEHMKLEHEDLHTQWKSFLGAKDKKSQIRLLKKFTNSLTMHMKLEEVEISPVFNKDLSIDNGDGPTGVISHEHHEITKLLNLVQEALGLNDVAKIEYAENHFFRALMKHLKREEETLYNIFDVVLTEEEHKQILDGKPKKRRK